MRAVVFDRYGPPDVLRLEDVAKPVPKPDELLVRIHATTVNRLDCHVREANRSNGLLTSLLSRSATGLRRPRRRILGSDLAGNVEAVGSAVTRFLPGALIFARTGLGFGAHAEYVCIRETGHLAPLPEGLGFEEAAPLCDGALNALWALRPANIREGSRVLIYGGSGAIGSAGVQLAKYLGAEVTAVCGTKNLGLMSSLGADAVIDYTREDFTENGEKYDVVFDAVGKESFAHCRGSLRPGGYYLAVDGLSNLMRTPWTRWFGDKKVIFRIPPRYTRGDVIFLKQLVEKGAYRPVIDRRYALEEVVEATRFVEAGEKTGNVVVRVSTD